METKTQLFKTKFPSLSKVIGVLNANKIDWLIAGSGCLFLLGNNREPGDVDIFIPADQHDLADKAFDSVSEMYRSETEVVRNSHPYNEHEMQLTSGLQISVANKVFNLDINQSVINHSIDVDGLHLMPPEDVILIKAILQRGSDVGKHDIEDIQKFLDIYPNIRWDYLQTRIQEIDATQCVSSIFNKYFS